MKITVEKILDTADKLSRDHLGEYIQSLTTTNDRSLYLSQLVAAIRTDVTNIDWVEEYFIGQDFSQFKSWCVEYKKEELEAQRFLNDLVERLNK